MFSGVNFAQEQGAILFKIDQEPVYTSEFLRMYEKQVKMLGSDNKSSRKEYFDLFTLYKLKVKDAKTLGLDTLTSFKKEFEGQRERLLQPYLKDESTIEFLVQQAYDRTITEVNASHILINVNPEFTAQDTLIAFQKITVLRNRILNGESFESVSKAYSEDPSTKINGSNLGYFSAFQMLYPFENAAYNTPVGKISEPFRTSFGYHIVQTNGFRKILGEREVAHIMIGDVSEAGKKRVDSIYNILKRTPEKFESLAITLSDDSATSQSGGKLPKMGLGDAIESFEKVVFYELKEAQDISLPFKTEYGWHVAKLLKVYPIPTYEDLYMELKQKVLSDDRSSLELSSLAKKLEKQYVVVENAAIASKIFTVDWSIPESDKKLSVISVNGENYLLEDFIVFLKSSKNKAGTDSFRNFKTFALIDYYKRHLEETDENFRALLKEFKEGLLLFNLMEKKVWNPSKNNDAQRTFYEGNKGKYKQPFEAVHGKVIGDYQAFLEVQWVKQIKKDYTLEINADAYRKTINEE